VLWCTRRDLDQDVGDVGDRDRLDQQRRHLGHLPVPRPPQDHGGVVEELGGSQNRGGDWAGQRDPLLGTFAGVAGVALDPVDAHDRQRHMVADAGVVLGGQQLPGGGGGEECPRLLGAAGRGVGDIDHGIDPPARPPPRARS
jgi:hypothetical protein